jgi:hypothetical protein
MTACFSLFTKLLAVLLKAVVHNNLREKKERKRKKKRIRNKGNY